MPPAGALIVIGNGNDWFCVWFPIGVLTSTVTFNCTVLEPGTVGVPHILAHSLISLVTGKLTGIGPKDVSSDKPAGKLLTEVTVTFKIVIAIPE